MSDIIVGIAVGACAASAVFSALLIKAHEKNIWQVRLIRLLNDQIADYERFLSRDEAKAAFRKAAEFRKGKE
jgi:cobalamin biosynthesis protein CbiD